MEPTKEVLCIVPSCGRPLHTPIRGARGLCYKCYAAANFQIKRGKTTWAELERLGLALPAVYKMTDRVFSTAFKQAKAGGAS